MQPQPKIKDERELMRQLQEKRETPDHRDPQWTHEFWESDNDRIRRELGFRLLRRGV